MSEPSTLDRLVSDVLASAKYKDICPDLIKMIGEQELSKRRNHKETLKATKNKLHQIGGAYLVGSEDYENWQATLQLAAQSGSSSRLQEVCRTIMSAHASTRERLPILDQFYGTILADLSPITSILDIACGLSPLAIPWMKLAPQTSYYACDIFQQMTDFLNQVMVLMHVQGCVETRDVLQNCPQQQVDLALLLKSLPCLEQVDRQAGYHLLRKINARHLIVSFPIYSLGGRSKGMTEHYEAHFRELIAGEQWKIKRYLFATELVFIINK